MSSITDIRAREILDSRGNPTLEVDVFLDSGAFGRAAVPSGASTGSHEALELRDQDPQRYGGKGVRQAVHHVTHEIYETLSGLNAYDQGLIDSIMIDLDGTPKKSRLGANSLLGVSLAVARAACDDAGMPLYRYLGGLTATTLPMPMMNVINGGAHANNGLGIQEFMIIPSGSASFSQGLAMGCHVFHTLKNLLSQGGQSTAVGDEGGFAPMLSSTKEAMDFLMKAIEKAGYQPGKDITLALDVAANELYQGGHYHLDGKVFDAPSLVGFYQDLAERYPLVSLEDAFSEDDFQAWALLTQELGSKMQLIGDDLFVTQTQRLEQGIQEKWANGILIKPNQVGTLTETMETIALAKKAGFKTVMSHRSGETEDAIIADLAVGLNTGQIKTGSLSRSDRLSKYNQLLRIEEEIDTSTSGSII